MIKRVLPYILHPLRVMFSLDNPILKTIALLHDLIEDTQITISDLRTFDFPDEILDAILALTKKNNETYDDFIARVNQNALAKQVKIADLKDNMDITRLSDVTVTDIERLQKYHNSLKFLENSETV